MFETKIKNNEVIIDGVPYSKWTTQEWEKWKANTQELLNQCERMYQKLSIIAQNWSMK
ncbi:MAG: hypothetical protein IIC67_05330 [Thaumarchaeota archaeon]|nr:hypothetical protein [Nitrososphaerota archaeon]